MEMNNQMDNENGIELLNNNGNANEEEESKNILYVENVKNKKDKRTLEEDAEDVHSLDRLSRYVFPTLYIVFLICYFISYSY